MWGIKSAEMFKTTALVLVIIMVFVLLLTKNSNAIMRVMVGQEVKLNTAGFEEMATQHFLIKYTAVDQDYMGIIAESAEEAVASVNEEFGWEPSRKTTLVVYPNGQSLASSFGWDKNEKAMGVYWGGSIRVLSPREWLTGDDIKEKFMKEGPMVHEFTHLMVDEITRGNYNRWWTEGIAQYAEKKITGFQFADPFTGGRDMEYYNLEKLASDFDRLDQQVAYWESLQLVEYIIDQYGEDEIFNILEQLGQNKTMAQAVQECLEIDYNTFEKNFYQSLSNN